MILTLQFIIPRIERIYRLEQHLQREPLVSRQFQIILIFQLAEQGSEVCNLPVKSWR